MVERYWLGIHKVPGTAESTGKAAPGELQAIAKEMIAYDFSKLDSGDDQLAVHFHGPSDAATALPGLDAPSSWITHDLFALPAALPPADKKDPA